METRRLQMQRKKVRVQGHYNFCWPTDNPKSLLLYGGGGGDDVEGARERLGVRRAARRSHKHKRTGARRGKTAQSPDNNEFCLILVVRRVILSPRQTDRQTAGMPQCIDRWLANVCVFTVRTKLDGDYWGFTIITRFPPKSSWKLLKHLLVVLHSN